MDNILKRLDADSNLDLFTSLEGDQREQYLQEVVDFARSYENELKRYCLMVKPTDFCSLLVIYEALSTVEEETGAWAGFLADEFIRIFEGAKKAPNPSSYMYSIEYITILHPSNKSLEQKIIGYLCKELASSKDIIKYKAARLLSYWIDEDNFSENQVAIRKIKTLLEDGNWKIRWNAHDILKGYGIYQRENKLGFMDRFRGMIGNPYDLDTTSSI